MSKQLINSYYNQHHKIKQFGGSRNEGAISRAFAQLTDWALDKFREHYGSVPSASADGSMPNTRNAGLEPPANAGGTDTGANISKQDIFQYVYAVLHDPAYRAKISKNGRKWEKI